MWSTSSDIIGNLAIGPFAKSWFFGTKNITFLNGASTATCGEIMAETHALRLQALERKTEQVKVSDPWHDEMTSPSEKTTRGPRNEGTKPGFLWSF